MNLRGQPWAQRIPRCVVFFLGIFSTFCCNASDELFPYGVWKRNPATIRTVEEGVAGYQKGLKKAVLSGKIQVEDYFAKLEEYRNSLLEKYEGPYAEFRPLDNGRLEIQFFVKGKPTRKEECYILRELGYYALSTNEGGMAIYYVFGTSLESDILFVPIVSHYHATRLVRYSPEDEEQSNPPPQP